MATRPPQRYGERLSISAGDRVRNIADISVWDTRKPDTTTQGLAGCYHYRKKRAEESASTRGLAADT